MKKEREELEGNGRGLIVGTISVLPRKDWEWMIDSFAIGFVTLRSRCN